jgi:hypothetical protein
MSRTGEELGEVVYRAPIDSSPDGIVAVHQEFQTERLYGYGRDRTSRPTPCNGGWKEHDERGIPIKPVMGTEMTSGARDQCG